MAQAVGFSVEAVNRKLEEFSKRRRRRGPLKGKPKPIPRPADPKARRKPIDYLEGLIPHQYGVGEDGRPYLIKKGRPGKYIRKEGKFIPNPDWPYKDDNKNKSSSSSVTLPSRGVNSKGALERRLKNKNYQKEEARRHPPRRNRRRGGSLGYERDSRTRRIDNIAKKKLEEDILDKGDIPMIKYFPRRTHGGAQDPKPPRGFFEKSSIPETPSKGVNSKGALERRMKNKGNREDASKEKKRSRGGKPQWQPPDPVAPKSKGGLRLVKPPLKVDWGEPSSKGVNQKAVAERRLMRKSKRKKA